MKSKSTSDNIFKAAETYAFAAMPRDVSSEAVQMAGAAIVAAEACLLWYERHGVAVHPAFEALKLGADARTQIAHALTTRKDFIVLMPSPRKQRVGIAQPTIFYPAAAEWALEVGILGSADIPSLEAATTTLFGLPYDHFRILVRFGLETLRSPSPKGLDKIVSWGRVPDGVWNRIQGRLVHP